ncbi:MAG: RdgB/HAM1 family non-canonical purine NTP pyrophosphatase [Caldiserica bacterium]|nr:RdgB/HAM1 family non-canonical purine NTP pyrophosphatase [Caldisericota bacterium]MDH7562517.1 RdgB/HAM1 family non-canonical purine NTP pyrophosphatase [Caldisericota bacterium]
MTLVCATNNLHKLGEIKQILSSLPLEVLSLNDFPRVFLPAECGRTYEENALLKARQVFHFLGIPSISDDTGLEVDALGGRPGIFSSRYGDSDSQRRERLLKELDGIPWEKRRARFVCVVAFVHHQGEAVFRGEVPGLITFEERGTRGFGYDPLFFLPEVGKTYAELSPEEKNKLSHRFLALSRLKDFLIQNPHILL